MPLPTDTRASWPPANEQPNIADVQGWSAWYSGDIKQLTSTATAATRPSDRVRFWSNRGRPPNAKPKRRMHVPVAGDIAATSASLLFGEPVKINAGADTSGAQDRIDELRDLVGLDNQLLEGGEVCAALGGVYLRPVWDADVAAHPLSTIVHPDQAIPDFRFGRLAAVTFFEEVGRTGDIVWRHLERHEPGMILHGLYEGTSKELGKRIDLDKRPETKDYDDELRFDGAMENRLLPEYVPNVLPNRRRRTSPQGRADFAGLEEVLDAFDETWTSWMRDLRLGAARLMVPQQYLSSGGSGRGATFDLDQELLVPYSADPNTMDKGAGIDQVQFELRVDEHAATATALFTRIVDGSGYSPETFGIHESGPADSGRALKIRQGKTMRTKGRKEGYFRSPLARYIETLLAIDKAIFNGPAEPVRPTISFADGITDDPRETAETLDMLNRAQAMSTRMKVKMAQPELDGNELDQEVARVLAETGQAVPDPTLTAV